LEQEQHPDNVDIELQKGQTQKEGADALLFIGNWGRIPLDSDNMRDPLRRIAAFTGPGRGHHFGRIWILERSLHLVRRRCAGRRR